jgi:hypothetical protein
MGKDIDLKVIQIFKCGNESRPELLSFQNHLIVTQTSPSYQCRLNLFIIQAHILVFLDDTYRTTVCKRPNVCPELSG